LGCRARVQRVDVASVVHVDSTDGLQPERNGFDGEQAV
jgi:hypothetical protein